MKLHDTLTGSDQILKPRNGSTVKIYTCGLTVYSQPHIGNWLGYIYWDVLIRILEADGLSVERTQNITDVGHLVSDDDEGEDKLDRKAKFEGTTAWNIAGKYAAIAEHEAYTLLRLRRPNHLVRATDYIEQQIAFARQLETKGLTYLIEGEGLYFDTSKLNDYGKLARLNTTGLQGGKRVAITGKKSVTDFALWKLSPTRSKRDMEWDSPWGVGFPGWHLECSVIAKETLGEQIDIHAGGIDHIPVHHTNEIAQTESLTNISFANIWLHNNHIKIEGTKISKSLGNTITLNDIIEKGYDLNAFKILALSKHYRTEGNFDWTILEAASNRFNHWRSIAVLRHQTHRMSGTDIQTSIQAAIGALHEVLRNDLDTPAALTVIDQSFGKLENTSLAHIDRHGLVQFLESIDELLGVDILSSTPDITDDAKQIILERRSARENKDWQRSDQLREQLQEMNIGLNDGPFGTVWYYL
jgi:cysteinyl-tRNA synthetase